MKFFSILISLFISFNLLAAGNGGERLAQLVDEFQYSVTIEWDQKDKEAFKKIADKFNADLKQLMKEENLSKEELVTLLESRVNNKKLLEELKLKAQHMSSTPTSSEMLNLVEEMKGSMYARGASWNGDVLLPVGLSVIVITFFTIVISTAIREGRSCEKKGGTTVTTQENCGIRSVCVTYGDSYCYEYAERYKCDERSECVF